MKEAHCTSEEGRMVDVNYRCVMQAFCFESVTGACLHKLAMVTLISRDMRILIMARFGGWVHSLSFHKKKILVTSRSCYASHMSKSVGFHEHQAGACNFREIICSYDLPMLRKSPLRKHFPRRYEFGKCIFPERSVVPVRFSDVFKMSTSFR